MEVTAATSPLGHFISSHLLLALLQSSFLHQSDELAAVFISDSHVTATRDEINHLAITQHGAVHQLFTKAELKSLSVHCLHGLQQVYLMEIQANISSLEGF